MKDKNRSERLQLLSPKAYTPLRQNTAACQGKSNGTEQVWAGPVISKGLLSEGMSKSWIPPAEDLNLMARGY